MTGSTSFFYSGWEHIVDVNAYDHLLFIMTLCAALPLSNGNSSDHYHRIHNRSQWNPNPKLSGLYSGQFQPH